MNQHQVSQARPISARRVLGGLWPCEGCGELCPVQASWVARDDDGLTMILCGACALPRVQAVPAPDTPPLEWSQLPVAV